MLKITENEFKLLTELIKKNYGIHLKKEKETLIIGRLHKVLSELGFTTFTEYYKYLVSDKTGHALEVLIDKISTNHTFFMREPEHFYFFRDHLLPYFKSVIKDRDFRLWCAASSTGEEPYTLAMILTDYFEKIVPTWDTKLLATDISQSALSTAKSGIYSKERLEDLPAMWKNKYFLKKDNQNLIITEKIKREVIYRRFNLIDDVFPFKKRFHVIFCRNVMIYFDAATKEQLVNKLYDQLEEGGYLFIGHSESINREASNFKYIKPAVYRKV